MHSTSLAVALASTVSIGCTGQPQLHNDVPAPEQADTEATQDPVLDPFSELPAAVVPPVEWRRVAQLSVDELGDAGALRVDVPPHQRFAAVRVVPTEVSALSTARACHRLTVLPSTGQAAMPNFVPGPGAGWVILPGPYPTHALSVELHIALVDCGLGIAASRARFPAMPHTLDVEVAWEPAREEAGMSFGVRVLVATDSGWGTRADDPMIASAWAVAAERFADIGITLEIQAESEVAPLRPLVFTDDMMGLAPLDAVAREMLIAEETDSRFVPVAFVPCLEYRDATGSQRMRPIGQTSRIPGSFADPRTPSVVAIAAGDCQGEADMAPSAPDRLGVVIAHELGHYLGLRHVDTALTPDERLMDAAIATAIDVPNAWFSPDQAAIMRSHPDVVFTP